MRVVLMLVGAVLLQACDPVNRAPAPALPNAESASPVESAVPDKPAVRDTTERLFQNPYDTDAVYFLSQRNGTLDAMSVLIKRVSQEGTHYSRWVFNCKQSTAQNFGVATNLQALDAARNSLPSEPQHYTATTRLGAIAAAVCQP